MLRCISAMKSPRWVELAIQSIKGYNTLPLDISLRK